jgi:hypothetical protein
VSSSWHEVVQRLVEEERIRWLLARLPQVIDVRDDEDLVARFFTAQVEVTLTSPARRVHGHDELAEAVRGWWDEWQGTASFVTNLAVHWEGEVAVASSYLQTWLWSRTTAHRGDRRPADQVRVQACEDLVVREARGWRIARRRLRDLGPAGVAI